MIRKKYIFRVLGMILFAIGVVLGMALFGISSWADLESTYYGFEDMGGGHLNTLDCPVLMTKSEIGTIQASFQNPTDSPIQFLARADFSNTGQFRSESSMITLDAHQSKVMKWHITSQDIDFGYFIFAQVFNSPAPRSFRQATCGIIVLNLPQFTGGQVFMIVMIIILVGIVGGLVLWETYGQPNTMKLHDTTRAMRTLGVLVLLGMLVSFLGSWILGLLIFAVSVLDIGVIIGFLISQ